MSKTENCVGKNCSNKAEFLLNPPFLNAEWYLCDKCIVYDLITYTHEDFSEYKAHHKLYSKKYSGVCSLRDKSKSKCQFCGEKYNFYIDVSCYLASINLELCYYCYDHIGESPYKALKEKERNKAANIEFMHWYKQEKEKNAAKEQQEKEKNDAKEQQEIDKRNEILNNIWERPYNKSNSNAEVLYKLQIKDSITKNINDFSKNSNKIREKQVQDQKDQRSIPHLSGFDFDYYRRDYGIKIRGNYHQYDCSMSFCLYHNSYNEGRDILLETSTESVIIDLIHKLITI